VTCDDAVSRQKATAIAADIVFENLMLGISVMQDIWI